MKLKNCPFCGSTRVKLIESLVAKSVSCYDCGGSGAYNIDKEAAIKAWNTRTDVWISVEDRLPEDKQYVLVDPPFVSSTFKDEPRHVLFWNKRLGRFQYYLGDSVHNAYDITHWRALPK